MVNNKSAPETAVPNSKLQIDSAKQSIGKKTQSCINHTSNKNFQERKPRTEMGEHPSLSSSKNGSSGSSSRLNKTVGPSINSTMSFNGNPYLSNKKTKSGQNDQNLRQFEKKTIPQARHDEQSSHQSFMIAQESHSTQLNKSPVNSKASNNIKALPNSGEAANIAKPHDPSKQRNQAEKSVKNEIHPSFNPAATPNEDKAFQPRIVSSGNVKGLISTNFPATSKHGSVPLSTLIPSNNLPKQTLNPQIPIKIPSTDIKALASAHISNQLSLNKQNPISAKADGTNNIENTISGQIKKKDFLTSSILKVATQKKPNIPVETIPEKILTEEDKNRMKLLNAYGPYITSSDASLIAARDRLRQALDQTRDLRAAFSDRVYKKYRILLRPVPKTVDEIIDSIKENPKEAKANIEERIKLIKKEKDAEKKEIPKRAAIISNSLLSGEQIFGVSSSASAMNIAESEQLFSAGLSLVILPEEDIDENEINLDDYEHRGPTDPETGQRLGGISSAAAVAAEALLDRTRRGIASRLERRRRNMVSAMAGEKVDSGASEMRNFPMKQFDASSSEFNKSELSVEKALGLPQSFLKPKPNKILQGSLQKSNSKRQGSTKSSSSTSSSNWNNKRRVSKSLSVGNVNSLLSLSANVEGRKKAAALAIHSLCPTLPSSSARSSNQHSLRLKLNQHPHPESKGGITQMTQLGNSSSRKNTFTVLSPDSLMLPRLFYPRKRKRTQIVSKNVLPSDVAMKSEAVEAVGKILNQFYSVSIHATNTDRKSITNSESSIDAKEEQSKPKKRKVTEIGMLRALRPNKGRIHDASIVGPGKPNGYNTKNKNINPLIAYSVLQALGLFSVSPVNAGTLTSKLVSNSQLHSSKQDTQKKFNSLVHPMSTEEKLNLCPEIFTQATYEKWNKVVSTQKIEQKMHEEPMIEKISNLKTEQEKKGLDLLSNEERNIVTVDSQNKSDDKSPKLLKSNLSSVNAVPSNKEKSVDNQIPKETSKSTDTNKNDAGNKGKEKKSSKTLPKPSKTLSSQSSDKNIVKKTRGWDSLATRRNDLSQQQQQQQKQQLANQHHTQQQFLSHMQAPSIQHNYSVLTQAGGAPFGSSPQRANRMGINPIDQRLNHSNAHLLNNHHRNSHMNQALNHNAASSLHFHGNTHLHHSPQNRAYGTAADWSSLGLISASPTMMGGLDLATSQAHAMIGHTAQAQAQAQALMVREQQRQHFAAAVRSNLNNIASLSAQQANILLNNGRVPNGNAYQQQRLQQFGNRAQMQTGDEVSMMASAGLIMNGQRALGESFPSLNPNQSQSLMYLAAAKESSAQFMKRPASAGTQSTTKQKVSRARPASAEQSTIPKKKSSQKESGKKTDVVKSTNKSTQDTLVKKEQPHMKANKILKPETDIKKKESAPVVATKKRSSEDQLKISKSVPGNDKENLSVEKSTIKVSVADKKSVTGGMHFFVPSVPQGLSKEAADLILKGCLHKIDDSLDKSKVIEYLIAVGSTVPIPKALVSHPLKERMNAFGKAAGNASNIPKEVIAAAIAIWLWSQHCDCFQRAFSKSGRIDVDPECKWLIKLAIDTSLGAILIRTNLKTKCVGRDTKYEFSVASSVSEILTREMYIDERIDVACKNVRPLVKLLDERRCRALQLLCRERVLIAALVSRNIKMTEQFSNAYASALVRAGEAIGHEDLCDIVQDESTFSSTLLPHDILSDSTGSWDDPCRSATGFSDSLDANDLTVRAHARAQLHKSLYRLQDKFDIKGGVSGIGPYSESATNENTGSSATRQSSSLPSTPRGGILRRRSSGTIDSNNTAAFTSKFNPLHYSLPLLWDSHAIENMPYGRYINGTKKGKRAASGQGQQSRFKKPRVTATHSKESSNLNSKVKSTEAVDWSDVARFFKPVSIHAAPIAQEKKKECLPNIFAPVFNEIPTRLEVSGEGWSDMDNSDDEDISSEAVLRRHQVVLDDMKRKLDIALDAKKNETND